MLNKIYIRETYPLNKRVSLFFLFSFFFLFSSSQNLVTNGTFEVYSACPNFGGEISKAIGWSNPEPVTDPDYFNACATFTSYVSVPANGPCYQIDCNGGAGYSGIWVLNMGFPNDGKDYIQTKLNDTLAMYHKYVATAHVSLSNYSSYAIGSLGMYFTPNAVQGSTTIGFMNVPNPQVKGKFPYTDTLNWMGVQDTFVAQGGELYLTIGNFSYDSLSDTLYLGWRGQNGSYYYIDSVTVYDTGLIGVPETKNENVGVEIFPNPGDGHFKLRYDGKENPVLEIQDLQGRTVMRKRLWAGRQGMEVDCAGLENGLYLYRVVSPSGQGQLRKLIIAR